MAGPNAPEVDADEFMRRLGTLPLSYQPGGRWLYHTGSDVLGVLIARASGQSLEAFLQERLFAPLAMRDTSFHVPAAKLDRLPSAYMMDQSKKELTFFDEANLLITASDDSIKVWDALTGAFRKELEGQQIHPMWLSFATGPKQFVTIGDGGKSVNVWDASALIQVATLRISGGESFAAVTRRVVAELDRLLAAHALKTLVLVSHVTPIKTLACRAMLAPPAAMYRIHLDVASLCEIDWFSDGPAVVRSLNDTAHLR